MSPLSRLVSRLVSPRASGVGRADPDPGRRRAARNRLRAVASCLALVALAACSGIPTSGPVGTGDGAVTEPGPVFLLAYGPQDDAAPRDIVQGFLQAGAAGSTDNFAVAREYLTGAVRSSWDPHEQVVVYSSKGTPQITTPSDAQVHLSYPVEAIVDADGVYTESASGAQWESTFDLSKDSQGQWRISGLPDGIVVSEPNFTSVYRSTPIYFPTKDATYLVPEVHWFPERTIVTAAVSALLAGPSAALRDAVDTGFPAGVTQTVTGVTVDTNGTALVDLSGALLSADAGHRRLLLAQLDRTLLSLPTVRSVKVSVAGVPMPDISAADVRIDPSPTAPLVAIGKDRLETLSGGSMAAVETVGSLAGLDARSPAQSDDGSLKVMLAGAGTLVLAPPAGGAATTLFTGVSLLAPSIDRFGWIWTGSATPGGSVVGVRADGATAGVTADWLADRTIRSIRVSRDGARLAVVSVGTDGVAVDLAAIVRNESGVPVKLDTPVRVGQSLTDATTVVWVDEANLAVLGRTSAATAPTLLLVPVSGRVRSFAVLDGITSVAAGKGTRSLYVGTSSGGLYTLQGSSWLKVADGVKDPAFPG